MLENTLERLGLEEVENHSIGRDKILELYIVLVDGKYHKATKTETFYFDTDFMGGKAGIRKLHEDLYHYRESGALAEEDVVHQGHTIINKGFAVKAYYLFYHDQDEGRVAVRVM